MADLVYSLRGITKSRPGHEGFCLRLDALDIARGQMLALVGPSGCGKSTALDILAGVLKPDPAQTDEASTIGGMASMSNAGQRRIRGQASGRRFIFAPYAGHEGEQAFEQASKEASKQPSKRAHAHAAQLASAIALDMNAAWAHNDTDGPAALRLRALGYVLQTGGLLPFLTAGENISLRCRILGIQAQHIDGVTALARDLGIAHLLNKYPAALSVGERQRTAIAAALAHKPAVVLADEPTAALDPTHAKAVLQLFATAARSRNITVVLVTHQAPAAQAAGFSLVPVETSADEFGVTARIFNPAVPE